MGRGQRGPGRSGHRGGRAEQRSDVRGPSPREWCSLSDDKPNLRVMSYNILSEVLQQDNSYLYTRCPAQALCWPARFQSIQQEIQQHAPDVLCLQEVDTMHQPAMREALHQMGLEGFFCARTGSKPDSTGLFWKSERLSCTAREPIQMRDHGLNDNAAQVACLRLWDVPSAPSIVIGNIHVLFNQKRGDVKLGQVRTLLDAMHRVGCEAGPSVAVTCGDFNSCAGSPLHKFCLDGSLDLRHYDRNKIAGNLSDRGGSSGGGRRGGRMGGMHHRNNHNNDGDYWGASHGHSHHSYYAQHPRDRSDMHGPRGDQGHYQGGRRNFQHHAHPPSHAHSHQQHHPHSYPMHAPGPPPPQHMHAPHGGRHGHGPSPVWAPLGHNHSGPPQQYFHHGAQQQGGYRGSGGGGYGGQRGADWASAEECMDDPDVIVVSEYISQVGASRPQGPGFRSGHGSSGRQQRGRGSGRHHGSDRNGCDRQERQYGSGGCLGRFRGSCDEDADWGECKWSDEALAAAFGRDHDGPVLQHPLKVKSAYAAVAGREPPFTTCHMQGQKTVDFVLYTPAAFSSSDDAGNGTMRPVAVLQAPPMQDVTRGMPTAELPSDHISLVVDFVVSAQQDEPICVE